MTDSLIDATARSCIVYLKGRTEIVDLPEQEGKTVDKLIYQLYGQQFRVIPVATSKDSEDMVWVGYIGTRDKGIGEVYLRFQTIADG